MTEDYRRYNLASQPLAHLGSDWRLDHVLSGRQSQTYMRPHTRTHLFGVCGFVIVGVGCSPESMCSKSLALTQVDKRLVLDSTTHTGFPLACSQKIGGHQWIQICRSNLTREWKIKKYRCSSNRFCKWGILKCNKPGVSLHCPPLYFLVPQVCC